MADHEDHTDSTEQPAAPVAMNRAERRAAAHGKHAPQEHASFGKRPAGSSGAHPGTPNAPQLKRGTTRRKSGDG